MKADVMVIGGAGSIGSALVEKLALDRIVVVVDNNEERMFDLKSRYPDVHCVIGDVRDYRRMQETFIKYEPAIIYNTSAYKHVPLMESNPIEAVKTNLLGLNNLCILSQASRKTLINVSTDKAVDPKSVMGMTKYIGEKIVASYDFKSLRLCNVRGTSGSILPILEKQVADGVAPTLTDKRMERYFITMEEAVVAILNMSGLPAPGVYAVDVRDRNPIKIIDLINDIKDDLIINVTGIRPGEKLKEALWSETETIKDTGVPGIVGVYEA